MKSLYIILIDMVLPNDFNPATLLYLNPELQALSNILTIEEARDFFLTNQSASNMVYTLTDIPDKFDSRIFIADNKDGLDISRLNHIIKSAMSNDGYTKYDLEVFSQYIPTIYKDARLLSTNVFAYKDLDYIITPCNLVIGDDLQIQVDKVNMIYSKVVNIDEATNTFQVSNYYANSFTNGDADYRMIGHRIYDVERLGRANWVRNNRSHQPIYGDFSNRFYGLDPDFNVQLYKTVYPDARLLTDEQCVLDYTSRRNNNDVRIGKSDEIVKSIDYVYTELRNLHVSCNCKIDRNLVLNNFWVNDITNNSNRTSIEALDTSLITERASKGYLDMYTKNTMELNNLIVNNTSTFCNLVEILDTSIFMGRITLSNEMWSSGNLNLMSNVNITLDTNIGHDLALSNNLMIGNNASISNNLIVKQNVTINNELDVNGYSRVRNSLDVASNISLSNDLFVGGSLNIGSDMTVSNNLIVYGDTKLLHNLDIGNNLSLSNDLYVNGYSRVRNSLDVASNISLSNDLFVGGSLNIGSDMTVSNNLIVYGDTKLLHNLDIGNNLSLSNDLYVKGYSRVMNSLDVASNISLSNDLFVGRSLNIGSNLTLSNNLIVYGDTQLLNNLEIGNNVSLSNDLDVKGYSRVRNSLDVASNISLSNDLFVGRSLNIGSDMTVSNNLIVYGDTQLLNNLEIGNNISLSNDLDVKEFARVWKNLNVASNISLSNDLFVGRSLNIGSNLTLSNNIDIKGDAYLWHNLYVENDISVVNNLDVHNDSHLLTNLFVGSNISLSNDLFVNHNINVNNDATIGGNINIVNTLCVKGDISLSNNIFVKGALYTSNDININSNLYVYGDTVGYSNLFVSGTTFLLSDIQIAGNMSLSNNLDVYGTMTVGTDASYGNLVMDVKGAVRSDDYLLTSDVRAKKNIEQLNIQKCFDFVEKAPLISYNLYYDKPDKLRYGFLAHEVEQLDKNLVCNVVDFIPNILQNITISQNIFQLKDIDTYGLSVNDVLKIFTDSKTKHVNIVSIQGDNIYIDTLCLDGKTVLLYGKKIHDFKTIDYGQMFAMSVGTMQVMMGQIAELKQEIEKIKAL